ncbi:hypothetical protein [Stieleria bergensis]|uniref:hypothetical protein n=1 Tax=Stieleria bergensis TaxID=2528025 RepID=UPI003AF39ACF
METRAYNTDNTLSGISFTGASIGNLSYGWDANKNKTSETITGTMSNYGFDVGVSGYDDEDRLVNWSRDDSNLDQSWNLSLVGDWTSYTENASVQSRTHGSAHELLTVASQSVSHDAKGNMTSIPAVLRPGSNALAMSWDFDNRLSLADTDGDGMADVQYKFDALGRRVYRDDGTAATVYVQNGQQTVVDYASGAAATSPTYCIPVCKLHRRACSAHWPCRWRQALLSPQPTVQRDRADQPHRERQRALQLRRLRQRVDFRWRRRLSRQQPVE